MQRHAVDMHLGRHSQALRHLMSSQPPRFDAALALARDKVPEPLLDRVVGPACCTTLCVSVHCCGHALADDLIKRCNPLGAAASHVVVTRAQPMTVCVLRVITVKEPQAQKFTNACRAC
jgi:hypothetical protein